MKRRFFAYIIITICVISAYIMQLDVSTRADKCIKNIRIIENNINHQSYDKAQKLCEITKNEYKSDTIIIMYCYYKHDILEEIDSALTDLSVYIKHKDITNINIKTEEITKKLLSIKSREQINIRNIL